MTNPKSISDLILKMYKDQPTKNIVGWMEANSIRHLSVKHYLEKIEAISIGLSKSFNITDTKIAILSETKIEWHLCDMAILLSRACTVPIYPTTLEDECKFILNHSEADHIFIDSPQQLAKLLHILSETPSLKSIISFTPIKSELRDQIPREILFFTLDEIINQGEQKQEFSASKIIESMKLILPTDLATLIYTSGTTGTPKAAAITHQALIKMLLNLKSFIKNGVTKKDRSLTFLPLSHVLGRCDSFLPLIFGNESIYLDDKERVYEALKIIKPTFIIGVPRFYEKLYQAIAKKFSEQSSFQRKIISWGEKVTKNYFRLIDQDQSPTNIQIIEKNLAYKTIFSHVAHELGGHIRLLVCGGAPLSTDVIHFFRYANMPILEGYGLTETVGPITLTPLNKQRPGTVGLPMGDVILKLASDGEILVKSLALFSHYYKDKGLTQSSFDDQWYKTGDIGEIDLDGFLKITDRKKDIIITSGGKNISPQKIESLLQAQNYISQALIIGERRKHLVAIIGLEKSNFIERWEELELSSNPSMAEIAQSPRVKQLIQEEIDASNINLPPYETIKNFYLAPIEFTVDNGLMTPSLKLKKKFICNKFSDEINAMYL
jgi:long-chain acyl-CoA synthetase